MTHSNIIAMPVKFGPARSKRRVVRGKAGAIVVALAPHKQEPQLAYQLYLQAYAIDDNDPMGGLKLYKKALELDPLLFIAMTNVGNCYFKAGDAIEAEAWYHKALAGDPNQPEANYNLGYLKLDAGNARESVSLFLRAQRSDPEFADAWFNLGMAYEELGCSDFARAQFRKYLAMPRDTDSFDEQARRAVERLSGAR